MWRLARGVGEVLLVASVVVGSEALLAQRKAAGVRGYLSVPATQPPAMYVNYWLELG